MRLLFKPFLLLRFWWASFRQASARRSERKKKLRDVVRSLPHQASTRLERNLINFANAGSVRCVSVLIRDCKEAGVSLDIYLENGLTPLLLAISTGSVETVIVLLEGGANPHGFNDFGDFVSPNFDQGSKDPLFRAVQRGLSAKGVNAILRRYNDAQGVMNALRMLDAEVGPYEHDCEQGIAVRVLLLYRLRAIGELTDHPSNILDISSHTATHLG